MKPQEMQLASLSESARLQGMLLVKNGGHQFVSHANAIGTRLGKERPQQKKCSMDYFTRNVSTSTTHLLNVSCVNGVTRYASSSKHNQPEPRR
jgi:hypothetical protein